MLKHSHTQCGKVVKNTITKGVTKELISRKFLSVIAFYSAFQNCVTIFIKHEYLRSRAYIRLSLSSPFSSVMVIQI